MKVLILAAGRGKRLEKTSKNKNKCMIKIERKPLIEYGLDCASQIDVSEVVIVVGHKADQIISAYGNNYKKKPIKYVFQPEQKGLVHAIECAKDAIKNEDFILMLGDELLIKPKHIEMIKKFNKEKLFGVCGTVNVKNKNLIKKTYALFQQKDNKIIRLIEKPLKPINNIMGTGNCLFRNKILSYIGKTPINQNRGEKELPDLIQQAIDNGNAVNSFIVCDRYFNINSKEEIDDTKSYFSHL